VYPWHKLGPETTKAQPDFQLRGNAGRMNRRFHRLAQQMHAKYGTNLYPCCLHGGRGLKGNGVEKTSHEPDLEDLQVRLNYSYGPRATEQDGGMSKRTEGQQALTKETNCCQIVVNTTQSRLLSRSYEQPLVIKHTAYELAPTKAYACSS
jgi:hypothetical protein